MQVSVTRMDEKTLLEEIAAVFPAVPMPARQELPFHKSGCAECLEVAADLEQYRGKEVSADVVRGVHQELSHLSAKAWQWLLPDYLRFCLTADALYSRVETEFLIYSLGPDLKFQADTLRRFSLLTAGQLTCLIHFVEWCSRHEFWSEYFPESIERALTFLHTVPKRERLT